MKEAKFKPGQEVRGKIDCYRMLVDAHDCGYDVEAAHDCGWSLWENDRNVISATRLRRAPEKPRRLFVCVCKDGDHAIAHSRPDPLWGTHATYELVPLDLMEPIYKIFEDTSSFSPAISIVAARLRERKPKQ